MRKNKPRPVKVRRLWKTKPITKVKESGKLYRRHKEKQARVKEAVKELE